MANKKDIDNIRSIKKSIRQNLLGITSGVFGVIAIIAIISRKDGYTKSSNLEDQSAKIVMVMPVVTEEAENLSTSQTREVHWINTGFFAATTPHHTKPLAGLQQPNRSAVVQSSPINQSINGPRYVVRESAKTLNKERGGKEPLTQKSKDLLVYKICKTMNGLPEMQMSGNQSATSGSTKEIGSEHGLDLDQNPSLNPEGFFNDISNKICNALKDNEEMSKEWVDPIEFKITDSKPEYAGKVLHDLQRTDPRALASSTSQANQVLQESQQDKAQAFASSSSQVASYSDAGFTAQQS